MCKYSLLLPLLFVLASCSHEPGAVPVSGIFTANYRLYDSLYSEGSDYPPGYHFEKHYSVDKVINVRIDSVRRYLLYGKDSFTMRWRPVYNGQQIVDSTIIFNRIAHGYNEITVNPDSLSFRNSDNINNTARKITELKGYRIR